MVIPNPTRVGQSLSIQFHRGLLKETQLWAYYEAKKLTTLSPRYPQSLSYLNLPQENYRSLWFAHNQTVQDAIEKKH